MSTVTIPAITEEEKREGIEQANASPRRRYPKILHQAGAEFNEVFNFMMIDSYMQPHLHPGDEKIEKIYLVQGKIAVVFFDDNGLIIKCTVLDKEGVDMISVPAFTWHTYVMLSDSVITYETMMGKYEPQTWKEFFQIAPPEGSAESNIYLNALKKEASKWIEKGVSKI
ncbi:MAG: cupin fold metalloprotein WbuC family [Segetibacter sp.]|nr:cupin fold metalloprotein WbuC family [Segetibacter sp.]